MQSHISILCLRGKCRRFFSDHLNLSVFLLVPFFLQTSIQFCWNSCFSSVCSCENSHMSLRCWRGFFYIYILGSSCPAPKMNSYTMRHGEILYMQLNNIGITHVFSCINICRVPRMLFEHEADRPSVQHHPRDPASVNAMKQTCVIVILA